MARMILLLELGDWTGDHHGQSPYLVEFDSERLDSPFDVSEGWGHGLGGSCTRGGKPGWRRSRPRRWRRRCRRAASAGWSAG